MEFRPRPILLLEKKFPAKCSASYYCPCKNKTTTTTTTTTTPRPLMDQNLQFTHVKLLAFDLLSLTQTPSSSSSSETISFSRRGAFLSRAEVLGIVTLREHKPNKFLKFTVDDGTGCVTCVLWLNHLNSSYFSRRNPVDVRLISNMACHFASEIKIGVMARVRGRITGYRGAVQITVSDVVIEKDPNVEILHWLDCMRLAHKCYNVVSPRK